MQKILRYFGNLFFGHAFESKIKQLEASFQDLKTITESLLPFIEAEEDEDTRKYLNSALKDLMFTYDVELAGLYTLNSFKKKNNLDTETKLRLIMYADDQIAKNNIQARWLRDQVEEYLKYSIPQSDTRRSTPPWIQ